MRELGAIERHMKSRAGMAKFLSSTASGNEARVVDAVGEVFEWQSVRPEVVLTAEWLRTVGLRQVTSTALNLAKYVQEGAVLTPLRSLRAHLSNEVGVTSSQVESYADAIQEVLLSYLHTFADYGELSRYSAKMNRVWAVLDVLNASLGFAARQDKAGVIAAAVQDIATSFDVWASVVLVGTERRRLCSQVYAGLDPAEMNEVSLRAREEILRTFTEAGISYE